MDRIKAKFSRFKNKSFREHQREAMEFICESDKPIKVVAAPTGSGKSLIGMCAGASHDSFTYLVESKQLQSQLAKDFPELEVMKGRNNYPCLKRLNRTAEDCMHSNLTTCDFKSGCPYCVQKKKVLNAPYKLLNYSYYLNEVNYAGTFTGSPILICDEGDTLEKHLLDFTALNISNRVIDDLEILPPPYKALDEPHKLEAILEWAENEAESKIYNRHQTVTAMLEDIDDEDDPDLDKHSREKRRLGNILSRIKVFINNADDSWVFENTKGYTFKPAWIPDELSDQFFFSHADRFVLMSATFPPQAILGKLLGKPPGDFEYFTVPSTFPVENRMVYMNPVANITHKTFDDESVKVINGISDVLSKHMFEKGIIHCVSYKLTNIIMNTGIDRFITHNSGDRETVIEQSKASDEPLVLVSPSLERGLDLPDELCRFIIWVKAPWLYKGDKMISARLK